MDATSPYNSRFFTGLAQSRTKSAELLLAVLFDLYKPSSVADFGCGIGHWLDAARRLGATTLFGFDGSWVDPSKICSREIQFTAGDVGSEIRIGREVDLAISLETGEHLPAAAAETLIGNLTRAAPVVLFGAAIPGQGGAHHVNEQPQSYWAGMFDRLGYDAVDAIRPAVWNNGRIAVHYRQNTLLYIRRGFDGIDRSVLSRAAVPLLNAVHPETFMRGPRGSGSLQTGLKTLVNALPYGGRITRAFHR